MKWFTTIFARQFYVLAKFADIALFKPSYLFIKFYIVIFHIVAQ